ncbi:MAG TPA: alginate export family protein [Candidatus Hydrogenedentes bacterium]|nr:alginate export family protein [Candidatus Hydrogenedentota bacterium]HOK89957.1 alginate export family protein [Candidatus Hydrogenedentota bacterium]HOV60832.1 alginate export family protein [Candidatus Hydrogenedentota bacterium]
MRTWGIGLAVVFLAVTGMAELQEVRVGGSLSITGWYYDYDSIETDSYYDQWIRLNVEAKFTDNVSAFIEFGSYDVWGEDFRSDYFRGLDLRADSTDDVEVYQAYIEAANIWNTPLRLRVGRQELTFGSEWLIGNNSDASPVFGLSFDAIRATWDAETWSVDAVAAKLAERFGDFAGDDTDLYMLYGSCKALEDHVFDVYWMYVRDDYATTAFPVDLHTVGIRAAGAFGNLDYEAEFAWQFGGVDDVPSACPFGFGEADVDYDTPGLTATVGYTFDCCWTPRPFLNFTWLSGGDPNRSAWSNDRTLPFNRLFSDVEYSEFIYFTELSNVLVYAAGLDLQPTECLALTLLVSKLEADEAYDNPALFGGGKLDKDLGWEVSVSAEYQYSEDLLFYAAYAHLFGDDGLAGNYIVGSGLTAWEGQGDDDYDTVYMGAQISF